MDEGLAQAEVLRLKAEIYAMRSSQIDSILTLVTEYGKTLATLSIDMALVKVRTETLSPLVSRMDALERFQWKIAAWCGVGAAAFGAAAAFAGWLFPRGAH